MIFSQSDLNFDSLKTSSKILILRGDLLSKTLSDYKNQDLNLLQHHPQKERE